MNKLENITEGLNMRAIIAQTVCSVLAAITCCVAITVVIATQQPTTTYADETVPVIQEDAEPVPTGEAYGLLSPNMPEEDRIIAQAEMAAEIEAERNERLSVIKDTLLRDLPRKHELECARREHSQAAVDAGGIVEWDSRWYAAHNYDEGQKFYSFKEGDLVTIDGLNVIIDGEWYGNYLTTTYSEVRGIFGYDNVLFQTCLPNGNGPIVIYYGHIIDNAKFYPVIA